MSSRGPLIISVCWAIGLGAMQTRAVILETVKVGNPGNTGEWSGANYGGVGPDRICGAVDYAYRIGKYEVTAGQYAEFLNAVAVTDTYDLYSTLMTNATFGCGIRRDGTPGSYRYSVDAGFENRPVNYVSYWDACRFTNWLHNEQPTGDQGAGSTETGAYTLNGYNGNDGRSIQRNDGWKWAITSEDEWYKAAYHKNDGVTGDYFDYPTSTDSAPGRDVTETTNPGNNANYDGFPYPIDSPYYMTEAGEFELSDSPYGTFDQGGNVWEYNEAILSETTTSAFRGLRGGSFVLDNDVETLSASYRGTGTAPAYEIFVLGFRVVEVPEPSTLTLFGLACIIVSRRRR